MPVWAPAPIPITRWLSQYHQSPSASRTTRGARSLNVDSALVVHRSAGSNTWLSDEMILYPGIRHPPPLLFSTTVALPVARQSVLALASPDAWDSRDDRNPHRRMTTACGIRPAPSGIAVGKPSTPWRMCARV